MPSLANNSTSYLTLEDEQKKMSAIDNGSPDECLPIDLLKKGKNVIAFDHNRKHKIWFGKIDSTTEDNNGLKVKLKCFGYRGPAANLTVPHKQILYILPDGDKLEDIVSEPISRNNSLNDRNIKPFLNPAPNNSNDDDYQCTIARRFAVGDKHYELRNYIGYGILAMDIDENKEQAVAQIGTNTTSTSNGISSQYMFEYEEDDFDNPQYCSIKLSSFEDDSSSRIELHQMNYLCSKIPSTTIIKRIIKRQKDDKKQWINIKFDKDNSDVYEVIPDKTWSLVCSSFGLFDDYESNDNTRYIISKLNEWNYNEFPSILTESLDSVSFFMISLDDYNDIEDEDMVESMKLVVQNISGKFVGETVNTDGSDRSFIIGIAKFTDGVIVHEKDIYVSAIIDLPTIERNEGCGISIDTDNNAKITKNEYSAIWISFIVANHPKNGLGSFLLEIVGCFGRYMGYLPKYALSVNRNNKDAITAYKNMGFEEQKWVGHSKDITERKHKECVLMIKRGEIKHNKNNTNTKSKQQNTKRKQPNTNQKISNSRSKGGGKKGNGEKSSGKRKRDSTSNTTEAATAMDTSLTTAAAAVARKPTPEEQEQQQNQWEYIKNTESERGSTGFLLIHPGGSYASKLKDDSEMIIVVTQGRVTASHTEKGAVRQKRNWTNNETSHLIVQPSEYIMIENKSATLAKLSVITAPAKVIVMRTDS